MIAEKSLHAELISSREWIIDKYINELVHPLKDSLIKLIYVSDYACKHIKLLLEVIQKYSDHAFTRQEYFDLVGTVSLDLPALQFSTEIRQLKHQQLLRLLCLEFAGILTTEQAMTAWSAFADALILHGLSYCLLQQSKRYGNPVDAKGRAVRLYTLAMGKLGGSELNYSSDIDLIFAFCASGETNGSEVISNQQYFSKVIQQFVQLMQSSTAHGFVFRVDLRLRPNGDSGSLVLNLAAMETYYQEQGRDWERYAMVKARVIDPILNKKYQWFEQLIIPFVYKRYVDFSVIESLRSMKAMIEKEVQLNPGLDDIKRGKGGIREVEFIIQSLQLIRGGRLMQLRQQNALNTLAVIKQEVLLPRCDALKKAYLFLRRLENIIQSINDLQTHSLPEQEIKQEQVRYAMDFASWPELLDKLHQYQRIIRNSFSTMLGQADDYASQERLLTYQLHSIWQGHVEQNMAINVLASLGYSNPEHCYQMLNSFKHGSRCRRLSQAARMRLDRFMVLLMGELAQCDYTDNVLTHVIHLLENIVGRSAYLALLTENPQTLKELLFWFSRSPYITTLLVHHPFLLEMLLKQHQHWKPLTRKELELELASWLSHVNEMEVKEELLRQFKLIQWLVAARAELYSLCSAVRIGQFLADTAAVIVSHVFQQACEQLLHRYPEIARLQSQFAILAYGKLGSREMNYTSDLDLVFLYTSTLADEPLVTRLTQKIMHILTTRTQSGVLFSVDTRLRPSGSSGLLVSHLDSFINYQKTQAWTWEHQALIKARVIVGSVSLKKQFLSLKREVLLIPREEARLQTEIVDMRAKIRQHQKNELIKSSPGGLIDLEFLIQYLVLKHQDVAGVALTHSLSQLKRLRNDGVLSDDDYVLFRKGFRKYHHELHQQLVCGKFGDIGELLLEIDNGIKRYLG